MKIPLIEIMIEDVKQFALVAFLVDRDDFINDVINIRKELKITSVPYIFPEFPYEEANNVVDYYYKGVCTICDASECFKEISAENHIWFSSLDRTLATALIFTESLVKKYGKGRLYLPIILASILTGTVQSADFSSTHILTIDRKVAQQILDEFYGNETITTIQVNRESTWSEVEDTFRSIQKYHFGTKKADDNDGLMQFFSDTIPHDKLPDTVSNIKRDRKWYWQHTNGMSYGEIWKQEKKLTKGAIIQAIRQYKRALEGI